MAVAEATSPQGSVLGAFITFLFYGVLPLAIVIYVLGTPRRRRARRSAADQRLPRIQTRSGHATGDDRRGETKRTLRGLATCTAPPLTRAPRPPRRRSRASPGRSANHARAVRPRARSEARMSAPVRTEGLQHVRTRPRNGAGPMQAPSQASTSPGGSRAPRRCARQRPPRARPRQARASRRGRRRPRAPSRAAKSTGRQSATSTTQATPARWSRLASAWAMRPAPGVRRLGERLVGPCTWLSQAGFGAECAGAKRAGCASHRLRVVAQRRRQVQAVEGRRAAPPARVRHQRADAVAGQSGAASPGGAAPRSLRSGQADGCVLSNAVSCMQASNTRITMRHVVEAALHALGVEDLRHQHAIGQRRRVAMAVATAAGRRQAGARPPRPGSIRWRYQRFLSSSLSFYVLHQVAQHTQVVQRVDMGAMCCARRPPTASSARHPSPLPLGSAGLCCFLCASAQQPFCWRGPHRTTSSLGSRNSQRRFPSRRRPPTVQCCPSSTSTTLQPCASASRQGRRCPRRPLMPGLLPPASRFPRWHRRHRDAAHLHRFAADDDDPPGLRPASVGARVTRRAWSTMTASRSPPGIVGRLAVQADRPAAATSPTRASGSTCRTAGTSPGDTYVMDADGYFWYQARSDDMIVSCRLQHRRPRSRSGAAGASRRSRSAAWSALPDEERGQIVKAYVVLRAGIQRRRGADQDACRIT